MFFCSSVEKTNLPNQTKTAPLRKRHSPHRGGDTALCGRGGLYLSIFIQNIGLRGFQPHFFTTPWKTFFLSTAKVFPRLGEKGGIKECKENGCTHTCPAALCGHQGHLVIMSLRVSIAFTPISYIIIYYYIRHFFAHICGGDTLVD